MKKLTIALAALMVSVAAYGQGQFVFNNRVGTEVNARFILQGVDPAAGTQSSVGSPDWTVRLLGGPQGTPIAQLQPLTPGTTGFRGAPLTTAAGYVTSVTPSVPGVEAGAVASVLVRVQGPGGASTDFGPFNVTLGGGTITPPNLQLGTTALAVIPEPTTLALGALGLGALLLMRRRK